jgi:S1-C subfamily serine protease
MTGTRLLVLPQAIAASFIAVLSQNTFALAPADIFRQAQHQVVALDLLNEQGQVLSSNTALLIDNNKAATQCDLLSGATSLRVTQGSTTFSVKLDKKDGARNLCLLSVPGASFSNVNFIQDKEPVIGSKIYAISNALGLGLSISEGVVAGIREFRGESYIQFTAAIAPGSAGGGLFDADGKLIGLINYRQMDGQNVNFAVPARWLTQIEQRAGSTDAVEALREQALTMQRELKWQALEHHASGWTQALPDSTEAWLFLGYAQAQLKNWVVSEHAWLSSMTPPQPRLA